MLEEGLLNERTSSTEEVKKKWTQQQHWRDLPLNILSIIPLLIGLARWNNCDGMPLLPIYLVCLGGINMLRSTLSFAWKVPRDFRKGNKDLKATKAVRIVSLLLIGVCFWGAVMTLPEAGDRFPSGGDDCNRSVFVSSFLSSTVSVFVFILVMLYKIGKYMNLSCFRETYKNRSIRFMYESYHSSDGSSSSEQSDEDGSNSSGS